MEVIGYLLNDVSWAERRGRTVNTPVSYAGGPGSNLSPETGYRNCGFSWYSSASPGKCRDNTLKLVHDRFLPHPFQMIIHPSSFHPMLYNMSYSKASLNKL
jgi:hypothetical protein